MDGVTQEQASCPDVLNLASLANADTYTRTAWEKKASASSQIPTRLLASADVAIGGLAAVTQILWADETQGDIAKNSSDVKYESLAPILRWNLQHAQMALIEQIQDKLNEIHDSITPAGEG